MDTMVFSSLTFVVFFAVVLLFHNLPISWTARMVVVLLASYLSCSCAAWNPAFVLLLMGSTVIDWNVARRIDASDRQGTRRAWLMLSLGFNLGDLGDYPDATTLNCFDGSHIDLDDASAVDDLILRGVKQQVRWAAGGPGALAPVSGP